MKAGEWGTLVFHLSDPKVRGPLRIDPGDEPSLIEVGDILIHAADTAELLWSSPASADKRDLQVAGTAISFSDEPSFLINGGDDPQFFVAIPPEVHGPLKLSVSLKVVPIPGSAVEALSEHISRMQTQRKRLEELETTLNRLHLAWEQAEATLQNERRVREDIEHSLSWQLTAPMRAFKAMLRPGPRKGR